MPESKEGREPAADMRILQREDTGKGREKTMSQIETFGVLEIGKLRFQRSRLFSFSFFLSHVAGRLSSFCGVRWGMSRFDTRLNGIAAASRDGLGLIMGIWREMRRRVEGPFRASALDLETG